MKRALSTLLAVVWFAIPVSATEFALPPLASTEFLVERIEVQGLRRGPESAVRTQSGLVPGVIYTEEELWEAVYRVRRLPFVFDATVRLGKGSERGRYVLIFRIDEASRFFSRFEMAVRDDESSSGSEFGLTDVAVGYRHFVGRHGVLFLGADENEEGFLAGYTHYELFGTRASLTVTAGRRIWIIDPDDERALNTGFRDPLIDTDYNTLGALVVLPLRGNSSLRFGLDYLDQVDSSSFLSRGDEPFEEIVEVDGDILAGSVEWVFDTRDDAFLPASGRAFSLGLQQTTVRHATRRTGRFFPTDDSLFPEPERVELDYDRSRLFGSMEQYWRLGRGTVWGSVSAAVSAFSSDVPLDQERRLHLEVGYALPLRPDRAKGSRLRLEAWLRHRRYEQIGIDDLPDREIWNTPVYAGIAYRNRATVVRFGLSYNLDGEL